jgi:hypothetical protein
MTRVALFGVAALVVGCAAELPGDSAVDPRVTVLSHVQDVTVTPGTLEFPRAGNDALLDLAAGDIVVSGVGEGYLRSIDAISADRDRITFVTSDAELGDALIDGQVAASFGGDGKADTYQLPALSFSTANKTIVNNADMTVKIIAGSLALRPEVDLEFDVDQAKLSLFELVLRGKLTGSLDLQIDAREAMLGPEIELWKSPPTTFVQFVGVLPVVETVTTSVRLRVQAVARGEGRLRVQASSTATMQAGVRYDTAGGWQPVADLDLQASGSVPEASVTFNDLGVRVWLIARADVKLYGVVGPYVGVGPQIEIVRDLVEQDFDAAAGFKGEVGGTLKVGKWSIPGLPKYELFDRLTPVL